MSVLRLNRRTLVGGIAASATALAFTSAGRLKLDALAAQDDGSFTTLTLAVGGLDTREEGQPENSDVLILARIDIPAGSVRAISIPRDLYVDIPGFGSDKITRAYDFGSKADNGSFDGGAQAVAATISENFGVEIDGVIFTTFQGFMDIVDTLGGVDVDNPYDVYDAQYPTPDYGTEEIFFPAGENHLDGHDALAFARTRHQDGDDGRVMRQQLVLRALLDRVHSPDVADQLDDLVKKHRKDVRTDLTNAEQLALVIAVATVSNDNVEFGTLTDYIYPDSTSSGMWIYSGDWSSIPGYVESYLAGEI
jgi:LCP family protein required for cell wall assembly